jgi:hypothetical protein
MEAIKTYKTNPYLVIGTHHIPTWTTPLLMVFVIAVLMPSTSLLGHLCGIAVGYFGKHCPISGRPVTELMANHFSLPGSWIGVC